ncbi:MAG: hypothetical protein N2513_01110 [Deltaproteobacteria bacterium]|nr:hypothetical protein [Deltaproteobacteria bacterium]
MQIEKDKKNLITYSEKLSEVLYDETHPFKPRRARVFTELLRRYSLFDERFDKIVEPLEIDENILYLFHEKEYIQALKRADSAFDLEVFWRGIGTDDNPIFKGMFDFSLGCVACTFTCFREIVLGNASFAFNPLGGFHHALKGHAMGFCYLNDVAVVGKYFQKLGKRFAILDMDAHHGNGIQEAFYEDKDVLTISIHESGVTLFPGTGSESEIGNGEGYGYNVNIPLAYGTDDETYLYAFESIVPPLIKTFSPDFLVVLVGADLHKDDPMSHLSITARGFKNALEKLDGLADKLVALGAGGYSISKSPALWAVAYSVFTKRKIVDQFAGVVGGMMYGPEVDLPFFLREENVENNASNKSMRLKAAEDVVNFIRKNVFPIFGIS